MSLRRSRVGHGNGASLICLCFTKGVDSEGGYSKKRERITSPREPGAPVPRNHDGSGGAFFVNRTAGTAIACLLAFLLLGIAYIGSAFFTREHQLDHVKEQQKQMRHDLDEVKTKNQGLERRMVELATEVENLEDMGD